SANLAHDLGEAAQALAVTEQTIALATDQKLYLWLGPATCTHGWAVAMSGDVDAGIEEIQRGLQLFHMVGLRTTYPYHLSFLAEASLKGGTPEPGLSAVEEALGMCRTHLDCFYEAELLRLKGELLCVTGERAEAEAAFRRALDLASRQQAGLFVRRTEA